MSGREVLSLTLDQVGDLPDPCATCVFWELDPVLAARAIRDGDPALDKEAWLSAALLEWGSVGRIVYVDEQPAGYLTYAPPRLVPRAAAFPTAPVGADAILLMTARIVPEFRGQGLGRMLVQSAAKDVMRRGIRAIEAFGQRRPAGDGDPRGCIVPADYLTAVGFKTVRDHRMYPRLRLDLRTALSWREDMEQVVERLIAQVRSPVLSQGRRA
jgi:GNAT superfamily N-acetyltransferase